MKILLVMLLAALVIGAAASYYLVLERPGAVLRRPSIRTVTIGVITNPPSLDPAWDGFQTGMRQLGYEEGEDTRYLVEPAGKNLAETKKKVEAMIDQDVDAIYVMGVIGTVAAKEVTEAKKPGLPVVFGVVSNPVAGGLVKSLQSSENNLTGITPINEVVVSKRLEIFAEIIPTLKRVIFGWSNPDTTGVENLRSAVKTLQIELIEKKVADRDELQKFLEGFSFQPGDGIVRATDSVSAALLKEIIALSLEKKIPLAGTNANDVDLGALMSYGANYSKIGQQAARLMNSILKGTKPADLPIELPEEFEFVINAKTAGVLGLTIPPASLVKANRVVY